MRINNTDLKLKMSSSVGIINIFMALVTLILIFSIVYAINLKSTNDILLDKLNQSVDRQNEIVNFFETLKNSTDNDNYSKINIVVDPSLFKSNNQVDTISEALSIMQNQYNNSVISYQNILFAVGILLTVVSICIPVFNFVFIQKDLIVTVEKKLEFIENSFKEKIELMDYEFKSKVQELENEIREAECMNELLMIFSENEVFTNPNEVLRGIELDISKHMRDIIDGHIFFKNSSYDNAIKCYENALETVSDEKNKVNILRYLSNAHGKNGNLDKAIDYLKELISIQKSNYAFYYNAGDLYSKKCDHNNAINKFSDAIKFNSECYSAYKYRGYTYMNIKNYKAARADFEYVLNNNIANDAFCLKNIGICEYELNKDTEELDVALGYLDRAIRIDPDYYGVRYYRMRIYQKKNDIAKVNEDLEILRSIEKKYAIIVNDELYIDNHIDCFYRNIFTKNYGEIIHKSNSLYYVKESSNFRISTCSSQNRTDFFKPIQVGQLCIETNLSEVDVVENLVEFLSVMNINVSVVEEAFDYFKTS